MKILQPQLQQAGSSKFSIFAPQTKDLSISSISKYVKAGGKAISQLNKHLLLSLWPLTEVVV